MENYYYFLSTLSNQFPIRRKLKYFSTSEKRYRLFGKNSVRWGNWRCVDESGKRRYRWIGEWRDSCGYEYVRGPEGDFRGIRARMRAAVARLPTFQRVVHTRRPQGMPILRQVSWRSFTRGNAFLKDLLYTFLYIGQIGRDQDVRLIQSAITHRKLTGSQRITIQVGMNRWGRGDCSLETRGRSRYTPTSQMFRYLDREHVEGLVSRLTYPKVEHSCAHIRICVNARLSSDDRFSWKRFVEITSVRGNVVANSGMTIKSNGGEITFTTKNRYKVAKLEGTISMTV